MLFLIAFGYLFLHFKSVFKKLKFFLFFSLLQINFFFVFLDLFDVLMSIIIFFKKNIYFDAFSRKKHFKKQSLPQFQTL
jgi:hypothetical protein